MPGWIYKRILTLIEIGLEALTLYKVYDIYVYDIGYMTKTIMLYQK
jgi:hypothetical protein